ncbi:fibronectin type iii domain-containing 3ba-related [Anaeramoeba ignava]|uniref:Fibronectin type iii domain-containing 3ba-related n=1 Tax=Anaeramoeba ignava TaxID=1746090 RepID=A0A9Q0RES3_ANAIG|nr:fibronectin type iii domain-containing 3ba-related [Anaeramoeba ignava]
MRLKYSIVIFLLILSDIVKTSTTYADAVNGHDHKNDCSHQDQPCRTIERALAESDKNPTIYVAPGVYYLSQTLQVQRDSFRLYSTSSYQDTIIDGGNSLVCLTITPKKTNTFLVDGFTFRNCHDNSLAGAIQLTCYGQMTPTIKNCLFQNNSGGHGGAIYNSGCYTTIQSSNVSDNIANYEGGGFYCDLPSTASTQAIITFTNARIVSNSAGNGSENIYNAYKIFSTGGSGLACNYSQGYLGNCTDCEGGGTCYPSGTCICLPGSYKPSLSDISCPSCVPGTFSNITNLQSCYSCSPNTYTPYYSSTECIDCPINTTSSSGSYQCTPPQVNNFQSSYIGPTNFTITWLPPSQFEVNSYNFSYAVNGTDNWITTTLLGNQTTFTVNGIKSGTYKIRIQGINNQGSGVITEILLETLPPVAPDPPYFSINSSQKTPTTWGIYWIYPYDGGAEIIEYEIIYWRNDSQNSSVNVTGNSTSYLATGLLSGDYYVIGRSITENNTSSYSSPLLIFTSQATFPSPVLNLEKNGSTCDSILFNWTEPLSNGGQLISLYNIKIVGLVTQEFNVSNSTFQANASNLLSGSYNVSIRAYNGYYNSYTWKTMETLSAEPPGVITSVNVTENTSTSLNIEWEEPSSNGALINYYTVYVCEEGCTNWTTLITTTTSINITNLESGTYDIRISAKNSQGSAEVSQNFTLSTQPAQVPFPITDLYKQSGDSTWINLMWSEPESDGGRPIIAYEISYRQVNDSQYYNETSYVTQYNLSVATDSYLIKVRSNNSIGYSNYSNEINASTTKTGVPGQVMNVVASSIASSNFDLTWDAADPNGDPIQTYIIYYQFDSQNYSITPNNDSTTYWMHGLLSGAYSIQIAAKNIYGTGLRSDLLDVQTLNATTPLQVQSLTATQGSSMLSELYVTWQPPLDDGGSRITGYSIYYESESYTINDSVSIGNYTEYTFNNVFVSNYTVNVTAQNEVGLGEVATTLCITEATAQVPSQVFSLKRDDYSPSSITIGWLPPLPNGAPLLNYYISAEKLYDLIDNYNLEAQNGYGNMIYNYTFPAPDNDDRVTFVCDGLFSGTYVITVWSDNSVGESETSQISTYTLSPQAPANVEVLNATSDSPTEFELEWEQPDTGGSPIIVYMIKYIYNETGAIGYVNTSNNDTTFNVTGLLSGYYYVSMKAYNNIGSSSDWGIEVGVETLPSILPTEVVNLTGTPNRNELTIEWLEPESNGGAEIDYYRISWNNTTSSTSSKIQKIQKQDILKNLKTKNERNQEITNLHLQDTSTNMTSTTSFTITDLLYSTEYNVYVEPHNEIGYGNSVSISLATDSPNPKIISNIWAGEITNTSLNIAWEPEDTGEVIYTLLLNETISFSGIMSPSKRIDNLVPYTDQTIQIQSQIGEYQSNFSNPETFKTSTSIPSQVTGLKEKSTSDTTLTIQWDAANPYGSPITYYIVDKQSSKDSGQELSFTTDMTLGDLSASTEYTIKICAMNDIGTGPWSESKTIKTTSSNKVALGVGLGVSLGTVGIVVILIVVYRKRKFKVKLPPPPDFTPYMFGDIYDAEFSKKQKKQISEMEELRKLIIHPEKKVIKALFSVIRPADADSLCRALIYLLESESQNLALELIKERIVQEVALIKDPGTLFRSNSFASKLLAIYSRLYGLPYLYKTIGIEIYQICEELTNPVEVSEVKLLQSNNNNNNNPEDSDDSTDREINSVDVNRWRLLLSAQKVLYRISKSLKFVPIEFREISRLLQKGVTEKFPESKDISVGSFFFLRFVCPAVTAPESYGLVRKKPSDNARRHLILVAKTLQNVANGTNFREAEFEDLAVFISTNKQKAYDFFDLLASPINREDDDELKQIKYPQNVVLSSLAIIHRYISFNKDRLFEYLEENDKELKTKLEPMIEKIGEPIRREFTKI